MHLFITLMSWSLVVPLALSIPIVVDSNHREAAAAAQWTPNKRDGIPISNGSSRMMTAPKLLHKRAYSYSIATYTELIFCWYNLMKYPSVAAEIDDPERREEAIWTMCRKWRDVSPYDPAYLLGPKKKRLQWPDGGPWSYQVIPHPFDRGGQKPPPPPQQGRNDKGQQPGTSNGNEDKEEGDGGGGGGRGQNRLEFSLPIKGHNIDEMKRMGHDILKHVGSTISQVNVPSTESFPEKIPVIPRPALAISPLL